MIIHASHAAGLAGFTLMVLCATASSVSAQVERSPRQSRGLFGAPEPNSDTRQTFDVTASLFGGYDDDVLAESNGLGLGPQRQRPGTFSALNAGLAFNRSGRVLDVGLSAGSNARYYPQFNDIAAVGSQAGVGLSVHTRRTRLKVSQTAAYTPFYALSLFPQQAPVDLGDLVAVPVDAAVDRRVGSTFGTDVTIEQSIGTASALIATGSFQSARYASGTNVPAREFRNQSVGGGYTHRLTQHATFRANYQHAAGRFDVNSAEPATLMDDLDIGVAYNRPISRTRRTTIGFSVGSAAVQSAGNRAQRAVGDAALNHQMGRTWNANIAYQRGVRLVQGLDGPVFADSVAVNLQGSLSRRLDVRANAAYTNGELGIVTTRTNDFGTSMASARLRYALTRLLAVYGEYIAYRYVFGGSANLPVGFPNSVQREGIRAGLTMWVPLCR